MVGWDLGDRQVTINKGVHCGRHTKTYCTKDFIFNVLYIGYMYTYTQRKICPVYILEYILGDMEKQPRSESKPFAFSACCKVHSGH